MNRAVRHALMAPNAMSTQGLQGRQSVTLVFAAVGILLLTGVALVAATPYSLDEAIYILMADAARAGRLAIDNGYELFASDALKIRFLRDGPLGLVPQYPGGYGFLALPFYLAGGIRGLIFLNALAHFGAMAVTFVMARQLGGTRGWSLAAALLFGLATFAFSYAFGIWPHSVTVAVIAGSVALVLAACDAKAIRPAVWRVTGAGLLVGFGVTIRADVILVVPPILIWYAARRADWPLAAAYVAGLMPGLLLSTWLNHLKFGTWSPLTYGGGSGSVTLATYIPLIALVLGAGMVVALTATGRLQVLRRPRTAFLVLALGLAALAVVTPLRELVWKELMGLYVLVFDFQAYQPAAWEASLFSRSADGHLLILGQLKRSLLESLPYLGVLVVMFFPGGTDRRRVGLLALITAAWIAPFALRHWHGGSPANMRYFLPILPMLAVLAALAMARLVERAEIDWRRSIATIAVLVLATLAGAILACLAMFNKNAIGLSVASTGAQLLTVAIALVSLIAMVRSGWSARMLARASLALGAVAVVWAGASATIYDAGVSQAFRTVNAANIGAAAAIPDHALIVTGRPFRFMPQLQRRDSFVAVPGRGFDGDEVDLVRFHIAEGRRAFIDQAVADRVIPVLDKDEFRFSPLLFDGLPLFEIEVDGPAASRP